MDPLRRPRHRHRRRRRTAHAGRRGHGQRRVARCRSSRRRRRLPEGVRRAGARRGPRRPEADRPRRRVHRRRRRRRHEAEGDAARQGGRVPLRQGQRGPALEGQHRRARDLQDRRRGRRRQGPRRRDACCHQGRPGGASRSAHRAVRRRQRGQGAVGRVRQGLPEGRGAVAPDHARDPHPRLRLARRRRAAAAAGADRGDGHDRAARPALPDRRARRGDLLGRAARRPRRRRRLRDVLPPARDGGARRRQGPGGRARGRRGDLRPRGADLRLHGDRRHGRHVPRRLRRLPLLRRRHDPRRRGRRARLGDGAPRDAVVARREGLDREGPRALPRPPAPPQPRRVARLGGDPRSRPQAPGRLRRARRRPDDRARDPRLQHAHDQPGRRGPAAQPADHADLRPHPGEVPGRAAAGVGRRPGRRRHRARGPGRDRPAAEGGRRHQGLRPADHHDGRTRATTSRSSTSRWPATAPTRSRRRRSRRCATA